MIVSGSYKSYYGDFEFVSSQSGDYLEMPPETYLGHSKSGFRHVHRYLAKEKKLEAFGDEIINLYRYGFYLTIDFILMEANRESLIDLLYRKPLLSDNVLNTYPDGRMPRAGNRIRHLATNLILESCNPATTKPRFRIYPKAILAPEFDISIDFAYTERVIPIRMLAFPVPDDLDITEFQSSGSGHFFPSSDQSKGIRYWFDIV